MKTSHSLKIGKLYSRKQLEDKFHIKDATIRNGVFHPHGHESIWLFVTKHKQKDRTQYTDSLEGDILSWDGQTSGQSDDLVIQHIESGLELIVFYRERKDEIPGYAFHYEGPFEYVSHKGAHPAHFTLKRVDTPGDVIESDLAALAEEEALPEGGKKAQFINLYERNPNLRAAAVKCHGTRCQVCGFDFYETYGDRGRGFIEVHHLKPVSNLIGIAMIDPVKDMSVLCSNCHRMVHRKSGEILSLEQMRRILQK